MTEDAIGGQGAAPVLVVGAGPVGLTMAAELARYRVPVRLIDRSPHATATSKALVVWSRTLELMDRMGCAEAFLGAGLRATGATMRIGGRELAQVPFSDIPSPYNFACMIPQRDTERLLGAHLQGLGVVVERQVELKGFEAERDRVCCRLTHPDGREERVETPWLIGCDGAHSTVRHGLGLPFDGYAMDEDWILADVRLEGEASLPSDRIATYLHPAGPLVVFPMPGARFRIVAVAGKSDQEHPRPAPSLAAVQAMIEARTGGGFRATDPAWLSNFRINERKVRDYRHERVFLAGDAAHVHSPAGGQGMNTGMQDAINLAWKLAMVLRGGAAPSLLDSYSPERSAVGDRVLRNAARLTDMATLANPAAQLLRDAALHLFLGVHAVRDKIAVTMSETDIAYPKSPLTAGTRSGARLPPSAYAGAPPGAGQDPRFVLYAGDPQEGRRLAARYPGLIEAEARSPPQPDRLLIVRPDGYVGLNAGAGAWDAARDYLDRLVPG